MMALPGRQPTSHRKTGDEIGVDGEVEDVDLRCACGHSQTEPLDADGPLRAQMAEVSCRGCGRVGQMARAPKTAEVV